MTVALVRFAPGARTAWHRHPRGQTLHVVSGVALMGTRDGEVLRVAAGETAYCPPGEDHWHGATPDDFMEHLAMLESRRRRGRQRDLVRARERRGVPARGARPVTEVATPR